MRPAESLLEVLLGHSLLVRDVGEVHVECALGEIAPPDHVLDRGEQERRARNDQAFIGVGEQLPLTIRPSLR